MTREELLKKSKPILFNTEMVRAILDGRKTMTRRIIKFPINRFTKNIPIADNVSFRQIRSGKANFHEEPFYGFDMKSPYSVCDTLYVRETFVQPARHIFWYKADENLWLNSKDMNWKPSIHMPKEAARIFLRVTNVRVERLQDITNKEAKKEGVTCETDNSGLMHLMKFIKLWDSTIKKSDLDTYGWNANPWVWVIEFEQCEKPLEGEFYY